MGYKPDWQNGSMKKPAGHKCSPGMKSRELFHGAKMANGGILKGYADGGEADTSAVFKDTVTQKDSGYEPIQETASAAPAAEAPKNFGSAFKEARASGAKEFEYNGKRYTTQLASEAKPRQQAPSKTTFDDGSELTIDNRGSASASNSTEKTRSEIQREERIAQLKKDSEEKIRRIKAAKASGGKFVQGRDPQ